MHEFLQLGVVFTHSGSADGGAGIRGLTALPRRGNEYPELVPVAVEWPTLQRTMTASIRLPCIPHLFTILANS